MSTTPEGKVKAKVKKILKDVGAYYAMPATGGYGVSGIPDFLVCFNGKFIGIETKSGSNKPTELQKRNLAEIELAGGLAVVINEDNINELERILNENKQEKT
jgi:hypothetical protein